MGHIILFVLFVVVIYKTSGMTGVADFFNMLGTIIGELLSTLNEAVNNLNNGMGLIPTVLVGIVAIAIVKWLAGSKRYGKMSDTIIEKTLGKAVEDIITPVLNWINRIIFK